MAIYIFEQTMQGAGDNIDVKCYKRCIMKKFSAENVCCISTRVPAHEEVRNYQNIGMGAEEILNMYQYFVDDYDLKCSVRLADRLGELKRNLRDTYVEYAGTLVKMLKAGQEIINIVVDENDMESCREIFYYENMKLFRKEVYTDKVAYAEYYVTAKMEDGSHEKLARRVFYNTDGSVAYNQMFEGEKEWFEFSDGGQFTKNQLMVEFIRKLNLSEQDVVLLDGCVPKELMQAVFAFGRAARIVVLANHNYKDTIGRVKSLTNVYCHEWFPYMERIDSMIVSTEEQKNRVIEELAEYHYKIPSIEVIPADGKFESAVLYESNEGNLVLLWRDKGKADGFWIYDGCGNRICERRDMYQHYFMLKGCQKEKGIIIKPFVDTPNGSIAITESERLYVSGDKTVKVMSIQETLLQIKNRRISVARFGDGEIKAMTGEGIGYQEYNEKLGKKLKQIVTMPDNDKLLVCIPDVFEKIERYNVVNKLFWKQHLRWYQDFYSEVLTSEKYYGNAFVSRPYMGMADKSMAKEYFKSMKELFENQEILIVEGFYSRSGVGNDLFQGAKSVERIICPSRNAWSKYEEIMNAIRRHGKDKLILLMLGPAAKALACDLAFEDFWAVDIGHIDSEYEWYKMGVTERIRFHHKHTAECDFDDNEHIQLQNDDTYDKEIVEMLTDEH